MVLNHILAGSLAAALTSSLAIAQCNLNWQSMASGLTNTVSEFATFDTDGAGPTPPALFGVGCGVAPSGSQGNHVVRWDGQSWTSVGSIVGGCLNAIAVFDDGSGPALFVAGSFTSVGGVAASGLAKWNGSVWTAIPFASSGPVTSMVVHDDGSGPSLFVGGSFVTIGELVVNRVAKWNGNTWSNLAGGINPGLSNGNVNVLGVFDSDGNGPLPARLIAAGYFTIAGWSAANTIAQWDGSVWSPLAGGLNSGGGGVSALQVYDSGTGPRMYVGGDFSTDSPVNGRNVAAWDGTDWSALGSAEVGDYVFTLTVFDDGSGPSLYAGGVMFNIGGLTVNHVARWDGSTWSALQGAAAFGVNDLVYALHIHEDGGSERLVASGPFQIAGGSVVINHVGTWFRSGLPQITQQPTSMAVAAGESVALSMTASGVQTYQWFRNGIPLVDDPTITGSQTNTLLIDPVVRANEGLYWVTCTNQCGSVTSNTVELTVESCEQDTNGDGGIGVPDLLAIINGWGACP